MDDPKVKWLTLQAHLEKRSLDGNSSGTGGAGGGGGGGGSR